MQNHIKQWTCPLHTANAGDDGKKYYTQLFGLFQRPAGNKKKGVFHVYDLGVVSARKAGKPPPESGPRIRSSKALECLKCKDSAGKKNMASVGWRAVLPKVGTPVQSNPLFLQSLQRSLLWKNADLMEALC